MKTLLFLKSNFCPVVFVRTAVRAVLHVCAALLCASMAFIFAACDFFTPTWNEPVGEWFRKYTSEAAIDRHVFSSFYTGTDGLSCVSTESDCTVTFYMRNPQNYDLAPRCSFSGGIGASSSSIPTPTIVQDASDRSMLRMTLPQQFLRDNDIGKDGAKPVEINVRIGQGWDGTQYLREFGSYSFSFVCNSAPPALEGAVVYKEVGGSGSGSYVVFFNAPDKALMKERHSDVTHIIINGSRHEVAIEDDGEMTFCDAVFTKVSVSDINDTAKYTPALEKKTFTHISGRDIWRYETGHSTSGGSRTYTLSLADKLGVAGSATSASTNTAKLAMPSITTKDAVTEVGFAPTGVNLLAYDAWSTGDPLQSTISIIAPTQANGDNVIPVSDVTVCWKLSGDSNNTGTGNVPVLQGVHDLTVWAEKDGFESSDRLHYRVALLKDIYVAEDGTGRGTGAEIENALNIFGDDNTSTEDAVAILEKINAKKAPVDFTIHVSGTIKDTVASIGKQHDSEKMVFANSITIQGTNANQDILSGAASSYYAVLSLIQSLQDGNGTFTVKNITIQDGSNGGVRLGWTKNTIYEAINVVMDNVTITNNISQYGAGVLLQYYANCIMKDCTITENKLKPDTDTHASNGAGVVVGGNSTLTLKGTTTISENIAQGNFTGSDHINGIGAYVFTGGTLIMEDDACIQGNTTNYDGLTYGGGVYLTGSKLIMRGNATICGNTAGYGGGVYMITLSTVFMADNAVIGDRTALSAATEGSSDANKVSEASAYGGGGGVYIDGGTLYLGYSDFNSEDKPIAAELTGGIVGNYTNNVGGGVYMGTIRASLIMASGNISYNFADKGGGGVHMGGANIIMKGGSITGNKAHGNGGGVFMNGVFTMEGGAITYNTANCTDSAAQEICGGGVYVHGSLIRKNNGIKKEIKGNTLTSEVSNPSLQKKGSQWYEVGNGNCQDDDWESY